MGIFKRLVLTLGYRKHNHLVMLTQVERSRTDQVADILDQQQIQMIKIKRFGAMHDHMGVQMTPGAGVDLFDRNSGSCNSLRIIVGLLIPLDNGATEALFQVMQGFLKQGCLARTGRAYQVKNKDPFLPEQGTIEGCQTIVFSQNIFFNGNYASLLLTSPWR